MSFKAIAAAAGLSARVGVKDLVRHADSIIARLLQGESNASIVASSTIRDVRDGQRVRALGQSDVAELESFLRAAQAKLDRFDRDLAETESRRARLAAALTEAGRG